jgi:hypothetical protein
MEQAILRTDCATTCYLQNVSVYSNTITQDHTVKPGTAATGILMGSTYPLKTAVYTSSGNTFGLNPVTKVAAPNTYILNPSTDPFFIWYQNKIPDSPITYPQWQTDGNN